MIVLTNICGGVGISEAAKVLSANGAAADALEAGIKLVESDPTERTVGLGGHPNMLGEVECDASIMNGQTLEVGCIGALIGFLHPISVARSVLEKLPHVFLVGDGASRYASEIGAKRAEMLTDQSKTEYSEWRKSRVGIDSEIPIDMALAKYSWPELSTEGTRGTTTFLVIDNAGDLWGGVSTSGWRYKYPGRLGDSPIVGAGLYVDRRYGGAACTHTGEMTIRASTARSVVLYMKGGASVEEAVIEATKDLSYLKGGYLGSVIIHAISPSGDYFVKGYNLSQPGRFWIWKEDMQAPILKECS